MPISRRQLLQLGALAPLARLAGVSEPASLDGRVAEDGGRRPAARAEELIVRSSRPLDLETPVSAFTQEFTPNELFFVRSHFGAPLLDAASWKLSVEGLVSSPLELSLVELRKLAVARAPAVLQCAGNGRALFTPRVAGAQWQKGAVGQARWGGVPLVALLERAGVKPEAKFVTFLPGDHPMAPTVPKFLRSIPLEKARLDVLLAWEMNGQPLPVLHGAPLRAVVPGWAGDHWIKWLRGIRLDAAEDPGFYMQTGYKFPDVPLAPGTPPPKGSMKTLTSLPVKSLFAAPLDGARLRGPVVAVQGVAFGGQGPVKRVEVSFDDGATWTEAKVDSPAGPAAWQRFRVAWKPAAPGSFVLRARATDAAGEVQPREPRWNPGGYLHNAWDSVRCEVAS